jgi:uncharacterized circularly permuted ATP-grasp superfamily protein/uncharacterized alpha-E superfamily protein
MTASKEASGRAAPLDVASEGDGEPSPPTWFAEYPLASGAVDEMCAAPGELHAHWEYLARALGGLGELELERRGQEARRLLRENGVTYNFYEDNDSVERPWALDPIPVLLTSAAWGEIEQGLAQRAELLDLLLRDLYGPRTLLRRGVVPPEVVFDHPGFLRPCVSSLPEGARWLHVYAVDLARGPDGRLLVLGDRTQAPSGAGYALEARTVLSRVLPSLYRDSHVHRLALFFRALRSWLARLAPREDARVVVLTPGPGNETFFEHSFLASYLGYPLVQGSDLTVRDERVWLKTLDGLAPVDVILRRLDDGFCDPLELRADSLLGVAGLLHAVRSGNVAIANPLGTSVVENPGLLPFLPAISRALLSEEPTLPSVPTWWCGRDDDRAYVLENLDRLVVKPIFPRTVASTVFGDELSRAERSELVARIAAHPHRFVAQARVALSTAPVLRAGRLEPRPFVLRSFLVAREDGYVVMPGGLGRVSPSAERIVVSNQLGGIGKDVWVLASEPERQVSLLAPADRPLPVTRQGDDVPGRVADDLFWLGRYTERTEALARLLREVLSRLFASDGARPGTALELLARAVTAQTETWPGFTGEGAEARLAAPEGELLPLILDPRRVGGLRFNVDCVARTGRAVRDRLSIDASRVIAAIDRELARPSDLASALEAIERLVLLLAGFVGLSAESMTRGQGWCFLELGRCLERGLQTLRLLRGVLLPATGSLVAPANEALLAILQGLRTYRRRYRSQVQTPAVLDLLLLDESSPRSLAFQLVRIEGLVAKLCAGDDEPQRSAAERLALEGLTLVRLFDVRGLPPAGAADDAAPAQVGALESFLDRMSFLLGALADEVQHRWFEPAELPQQLVRLA